MKETAEGFFPAVLLLHTKNRKFFTEITITSRAGCVDPGQEPTRDSELRRFLNCIFAANHGILTCHKLEAAQTRRNFRQRVTSLPDLGGRRRNTTISFRQDLGEVSVKLY